MGVGAVVCETFDLVLFYLTLISYGSSFSVRGLRSRSQLIICYFPARNSAALIDITGDLPMTSMGKGIRALSHRGISTRVVCGIGKIRRAIGHVTGRRRTRLFAEDAGSSILSRLMNRCCIMNGRGTKSGVDLRISTRSFSSISTSACVPRGMKIRLNSIGLRVGSSSNCGSVAVSEMRTVFRSGPSSRSCCSIGLELLGQRVGHSLKLLASGRPLLGGGSGISSSFNVSSCRCFNGTCVFGSHAVGNGACALRLSACSGSCCRSLCDFSCMMSLCGMAPRCCQFLGDVGSTRDGD